MSGSRDGDLYFTTELSNSASPPAKPGVFSDNKCQETFDGSSSFYTDAPEQYQQIHVAKYPQAFNWVLNWPDAPVSWAWFIVSPVRNMYAAYSLDGQPFHKGSQREATRASIRKTQFGEHTLSANAYARQDSFLINAFFSRPNGRVTLYDKAGKPVATRTCFSRALRSLSVPAPKQQ